MHRPLIGITMGDPLGIGPEVVVKALADAYGEWITKYGVDGFRLDTAKHVDPYFFGRWLPLVQLVDGVPTVQSDASEVCHYHSSII